MKVLANDGISPIGKKKLEEAGFVVETENVSQENLADYINENEIVALCVRSATTAKRNLIDSCPNLRFIGRGGVGMDNIDVEYARNKGLTVVNTPASSSQSVAEMVMGQLFSLARQTYDANRTMPVSGSGEFKSLKKKYGKGLELRGKTLGIIGFGRIGKSLAQYALGVGMRVICSDLSDVDTKISFRIEGYGEIEVDVEKVEFEALLKSSDFVSIHVPKQSDGSAVLDEKRMKNLRKGVFLVNAARGGVIDEEALMAALDSGHVAGAALDVFDNEPTPREDLLRHPKVVTTPHIGAATLEAQDRIGEEMADLIIAELMPA